MTDQISLGLDVFGCRPARRVPLDDTSWIDHIPRLLDGADALFRKLATDARWEHRQLLPTSAVPVLSLGETRRFLVRRTRGGPSHVFVVESGDLVVMGGRCQRDWVHAVPKETTARGARISINFATRSARGT